MYKLNVSMQSLLIRFLKSPWYISIWSWEWWLSLKWWKWNCNSDRLCFRTINSREVVITLPPWGSLVLVLSQHARLLFDMIICLRATSLCMCAHVCLCIHACVGRFDDSVIEERRQCSEDLLQFSANIPALYSSQHIQDFFKVTKHTNP